MSFVIRQAEAQDAGRFHCFLLRAYALDKKLGIDFPAARATRADVRRHFAVNICYIMEENGRIVSSCSLRMPWGPDPGPAGCPHLCWVSTDPDYQRRGCARRLLQWMETELLQKRLRAPMVTLGTAYEHPWLVQMYQKLGYEPFGGLRTRGCHTTVYLRKNLRV